MQGKPRSHRSYQGLPQPHAPPSSGCTQRRCSSPSLALQSCTQRWWPGYKGEDGCEFGPGRLKEQKTQEIIGGQSFKGNRNQFNIWLASHMITQLQGLLPFVNCSVDFLDHANTRSRIDLFRKRMKRDLMGQKSNFRWIGEGKHTP